jgi:predicted RNase H-like nuclease
MKAAISDISSLSMHPEHSHYGAVLGIDVGWSSKKPTTGLCLIAWSNQEIDVRCCQARANENDRLEKLNQLTEGRKLLCVGIDGSMIPELRITTKYRAAEAFLSRGKFQKRGKPGPTNGKLGQILHKQATELAKLAIATQDIVPASYPYGLYTKAVVEVFPNAFLAVLHPDNGFPPKQQVKRRWTDILFPRVKPKIAQLLRTLLPERRFNLDKIQGHEVIASFLCALAALCVAFGRCVAVGDRSLGYIVLPPLELWGISTTGSSKWARDTLRDNWTSVRTKFGDTEIYKDNNLWIP